MYLAKPQPNASNIRSFHKLPLMLDDDQDAFLAFVDEHKQEKEAA